jgi:hypothetical protein
MKRSTVYLLILMGLFGSACVVAAVKGMERTTLRLDARGALASLTRTLSESPAVLGRRGGWPASGFDGLALTVEMHDAPPGRIAYDVVARVGDHETCAGAIEGGRDLARELIVGPSVLAPASFMPDRQGSRMFEPADGLCSRRTFPVELRFRHLVEIPSTN